MKKKLMTILATGMNVISAHSEEAAPLSPCEKAVVKSAKKEAKNLYGADKLVDIQEGSESDRVGEPSTPNMYTVTLDDGEDYPTTVTVDVSVQPISASCIVSKVEIVDVAG